MTFDDGIVRIFIAENAAEIGAKPRIALELKESYYFGYETLGINRYYTALQANQRLESVICVPGWDDITALDIAVMENGDQFKIQMVQKMTDDSGLKITKLSLERISEKYDFKN